MKMRDIMMIVEGKVRTFTLPGADQPRGGNIWFNLEYDDNGELVGVEEHDGYQGGPIRMSSDTWEQTFLDRVARRASDFVPEAEAFLRGLNESDCGTTSSASIAAVPGGLGAGFDPNGDKGIYKKKKPILLRR